MKTAAKVFIIIGMIGGALLVFPIVLGIFAIKKINEAETTDELTAWGIVTLIFVSLLGGIFMLLIKNEELASNKETPQKSGNNTACGKSQSGRDTVCMSDDILFWELLD